MTITLKSLLKNISVLACVLALTSCVLPKTSITSVNDVAPNEVLVIGRILMDPPMSEADVQLDSYINLSNQPLHKALQLQVSDVYYDLKGGVAYYDYQDAVVVLDGDYYYFSWDKAKDINYLGVTFVSRSTQANRDTMTLVIGGGAKISHSGKSRAVYVGDITFVRDEFFNIKDIKISQKGYKNAVKAFRKKYNSDWSVEQAKISSAK